YVLVVLRVLPWWLRRGRQWLGGQDRRIAQIIYWHLIPVAVWFLWPKRLAYFLIYLSLGNQGEQPSPMFPGGWVTYGKYFVEDYHVGIWSALFVVGSIMVLILLRTRLRPGGMLIA